MTEKTIIPNALDLAEQIAGIILRECYRSSTGEPAVQNVLLFGSTLRNESAHDIDLLAIHDYDPLNDFGFATIYDGKSGNLIPHPTANIQERFYLPECVLYEMGGREVQDFNEMEWEIKEEAHEQMQEMRVLNNHYLGELKDLPYIGNVKFVKPVSFVVAMDTIKKAIDEQLHSKMVVTKVKTLIANKGLDFNETLDLHVMNAGLLSLDKMQEQREIVVAQCKDPTFWNTVLTTGRLYNKDSGKFDVPVDQKYAGASKLFPQ